MVEEIQKMVDILPQRIQAVVDASGSHTRWWTVWVVYSGGALSRDRVHFPYKTSPVCIPNYPCTRVHVSDVTSSDIRHTAPLLSQTPMFPVNSCTCR